MIKDQAAELRKAMQKGKMFLEEQAKKSSEVIIDDITPKKEMKIVTVTSGKGGVGKSNLTANLATALTKRGLTPIVLDADLGLANIEIVLGANPQYSLANLIKKECELGEVISKANNGVSFISGGSGIQEMAFLTKIELEELGDELEKLKEHTELLLIDTGAGINESVLKFTMLADEIIVVVVPEPASVTDSYSLIKTMLTNFEEIPTIKILVNKAQSMEDATEVFEKLEFVCKNFLKLKIEYLGMVPYDENIPISAKKQVPVFDYNNKSKASAAYFNIASKISDSTRVVEINDKQKVTWKDRFTRLFERN